MFFIYVENHIKCKICQIQSSTPEQEEIPIILHETHNDKNNFQFLLLFGICIGKVCSMDRLPIWGQESMWINFAVPKRIRRTGETGASSVFNIILFWNLSEKCNAYASILLPSTLYNGINVRSSCT